MATYYISVGTGPSGDGSLSSPFLISSQTDLDDILDGTYSGSTIAASGDVYVFLSGTYATGIRINADGHDGLTFKSLVQQGAYFPNCSLGPVGDTTGNVLTRSTETTTFENLDLQIPFGSSTRFGGGTLNLVGCRVASGGSGSGVATFQMGGYAPGGILDGWLPTNIIFNRCILINSRSNSLFTRRPTNHTVAGANDLPSIFRFVNCTIVAKTTNKIWEGNNGSSISVQVTNSLIYGAAGTTTDVNTYMSFTGSANNWAYQFGGSALPRIGTSDPLFVDVANDDYQLRPDSPCINKGITV